MDWYYHIIYIWKHSPWLILYSFEMTFGIISHCTKMMFSIKDFFSKFDVRLKMSHVLKKSLPGNFIFWAISKPPSTTHISSELLQRIWKSMVMFVMRIIMKFTQVRVIHCIRLILDIDKHTKQRSFTKKNY